MKQIVSVSRRTLRLESFSSLPQLTAFVSAMPRRSSSSSNIDGYDMVSSSESYREGGEVETKIKKKKKWKENNCAHKWILVDIVSVCIRFFYSSSSPSLLFLSFTNHCEQRKSSPLQKAANILHTGERRNAWRKSLRKGSFKFLKRKSSGVCSLFSKKKIRILRLVFPTPPSEASSAAQTVCRRLREEKKNI